MARGKKTGGRDFKTGAKPGPGRPASSPELKAARKLTKTVLEEILNRFVHMSAQEIKEAKREPGRTQLELIVISILDKAEGWGDTSRLNFVLNRLGIKDDPLEVKLTEGSAALTPEQRKARLVTLRAMRDKASGSGT